MSTTLLGLVILAASAAASLFGDDFESIYDALLLKDELRRGVKDTLKGEQVMDQYNLPMIKDWTYDNQFSWGYRCEGHLQSPIDINTTSAIWMNEGPLKIKNGDRPLGVLTLYNFKNHGYNFLGQRVFAGKKSLSDIQFSGAGLPYEAKLGKFHFHVPSEHMVDGQEWDAELQFVAWNKKYKTGHDALLDETDHNAMTITDVLIKAVDVEPTGVFKVMYDAFNKIVTRNDKKQMVDFGSYTIMDLLPSNIEQLWRYHGSITVPPCLQQIQRSVLKTTVEYPRKLINAIKRIIPCTGRQGRRLPQPIYGRPVYYNSPTPPVVKAKTGFNENILVQFSDLQLKQEYGYNDAQIAKIRSAGEKCPAPTYT